MTYKSQKHKSKQPVKIDCYRKHAAEKQQLCLDVVEPTLTKVDSGYSSDEDEDEEEEEGRVKSKVTDGDDQMHDSAGEVDPDVHIELLDSVLEDEEVGEEVRVEEGPLDDLDPIVNVSELVT
jgi:hypothetical protein